MPTFGCVLVLSRTVIIASVGRARSPAFADLTMIPGSTIRRTRGCLSRKSSRRVAEANLVHLTWVLLHSNAYVTRLIAIRCKINSKRCVILSWLRPGAAQFTGNGSIKSANVISAHLEWPPQPWAHRKARVSALTIALSTNGGSGGGSGGCRKQLSATLSKRQSCERRSLASLDKIGERNSDF